MKTNKNYTVRATSTNHDKMMTCTYTTSDGKMINVWGVKDNRVWVSVKKGNRKATFSTVVLGGEIGQSINRVVVLRTIKKNIDAMPNLLSPNQRVNKTIAWDENVKAWENYGNHISDKMLTDGLNAEHEQNPVVEQEQTPIVAVEQVVEDAPMVEDKTNEQSIIEKLVVETREGVDKISNDTINSLKELAAGAEEGFEVDGVNIVDLYTAITLAQVNKKWESRVYGLLKNSWYPKDLKVYKMEVANKAAGLIKNPDSMTPEDITRLRLVAKEACDEDLTRICELTYELSVCLKNATAKASEILNIACPDPVVEEVSKVPKEVEQVVEEPKVDDDENKHWDIRIETTHNESDGNTYYLARVKRWDYIDHSINKNCGTLQESFTHYPCLKDNPKENKRVKDLIKSICVENRHLLKRNKLYCYLFDSESCTLFRNKVEERWQAETKKYENVACPYPDVKEESKNQKVEEKSKDHKDKHVNWYFTPSTEKNGYTGGRDYEVTVSMIKKNGIYTYRTYVVISGLEGTQTYRNKVGNALIEICNKHTSLLIPLKTSYRFSYKSMSEFNRVVRDEFKETYPQYCIDNNNKKVA